MFGPDGNDVPHTGSPRETDFGRRESTVVPNEGDEKVQKRVNRDRVTSKGRIR